MPVIPTSTPFVLNKVKETTALVGAVDPIVLLGAVTPNESFANNLIDGDSILYKIDDFKGNWESGVGMYEGISNSISRDTIISSSNFDALVDFPDNGIKIVTSVLDAKIVQQLLDLIPYPWW